MGYEVAQLKIQSLANKDQTNGCKTSFFPKSPRFSQNQTAKKQLQKLRWLLDLERWVALPVGTLSFRSFTQRPWKGTFSF